MTPLEYHKYPSPGKIEVLPSKPCVDQNDLSLAYTPGVAEPCLKIKDNPELAEEYTNRGNLVAVISNGSAVLGLGNIGALAGKPVMEGKAVLFKRFADIDVFDLELNSSDPDKIIETVAMLETTFGGINLEDIKAPECFYIEKKLKEKLTIPVFHDDQHGTAVITGAALINSMEITGKDLSRIKVVVSGAGSAGIACANFYMQLGVKRENIIMCDIAGVVYKGRIEGMNPYMEAFASDTAARNLSEALEGADHFLGVSAAGVLKPEMLKKMNSNPVIFALANPEPEIMPDAAHRVREDIIMATGRSDYPNQVNNVLGFPFIFRGALDVGAKDINSSMKLAASKALAALAKKPVPAHINKIYNTSGISFGRNYIIPKPFDERIFIEVSSAVAEAAVESGAARKKLPADYRSILAARYAEKISRFNRRTS